MMITEFAKALYAELSEELGVWCDLGTAPVKRLTGRLRSITAAIEKLRDFVCGHEFADQQEEINFFKHEKPKFLAERFFSLEVYSVEVGKPSADDTLIRDFYGQELRSVKRFLQKHQFLYQYFQLEGSDMDHLLFVRNAAPADLFLQGPPGHDASFSTAADHLFAKFMAYERLQDYLLDRLYGTASNTIGRAKDLKWTGEAINLVEVAYGWWLTGQLNDGNATITDIILWLEEKLAIKIGVPNKRWEQIAARTHSAPTKYLDRMTGALKQRIDQELDNRNRKRQARRMT